MADLPENVIAYYLGPGFIGFVVCLSLYGTTLAQSILYFRSFPNDRLATKCLVAFLCAVDTFHVYLISGLFWETLVTGRPEGVLVVLKTQWQLLTSFIIAYIVTFVVQSFFCMRVWKISGGNWIPTAIIAITAATQFGAGMAYSAHNIEDRHPQDILDAEAKKSGRVELISSLICDLAISGSQVYFFYKFRVGMKKTNAILHDLILLSVNMGILLCILTVTCLVMFEQGTFLATAPHFILSKSYVNSLIATLNSRKHFREMADKPVTFYMPTLSIEVTNSGPDTVEPPTLVQ